MFCFQSACSFEKSKRAIHIVYMAIFASIGRAFFVIYYRWTIFLSTGRTSRDIVSVLHGGYGGLAIIVDCCG
jgi:hypothetical protein